MAFFSTFVLMGRNYEKEIEILKIQIGCVLRLARLRRNLSQHQLSLLVDTNSTTIGRIERNEIICGWDKLYLLSHKLDVEFSNLLDLKSERELLSIVKESLELDSKLTKDKKSFYASLKRTIKREYKLLLEN